MKFHSVVLEGATERLIAAATATSSTEGVPKESGRSLVAASKGVRLYLIARQEGLARTLLDQIDKLMSTVEDEALRTAYTTLTSDVRRAIRNI